MITISELNENFKKAMHEIQDHYENMLKENTKMFQAQTDHNELWTLYTQLLNKANMNPTYHEYPYHECSNCKKFMNTHGNIIFIKKDNNTLTLHSIFDINTETKYKQIFKELNEYIIQKPILNAYHPTKNVVGKPHNLELLDNGTIIEHHHFSLTTPNYNQINTTSMKKGRVNTNRDLLEKTFTTISTNATGTVLDLINNDNLYRGSQFKLQISQLQKDINEYNNSKDKETLLWYKASDNTETYCHQINTVIGELLKNITDGMNIETAVKKYENMTAPSNYQRPKPIVTEAMIDDAKETLEQLGYLDSLNRRYATLDDIPITEIQWSNKEKQSNDIFSELKKEAIHKPIDFKHKKIETITFDDFMEKAKNTGNIEIYIDNEHTKNFMTILTAVNKDSKPLFKWNNHLSWSYTGNLADSDIKQNVKNAGGNVNGCLRFSIQWNDDEFEDSDLDAHCIEPNFHIYFGDKKSDFSDGYLDIDIIHPTKNIPAVENIIFTDINRMEKGKYKFYVHNYNNNHGNNGFKAEIEYDGIIRKYHYQHPLHLHEKVDVADVTLTDNKTFSINEHLPSTNENKSIWNIPINTFQPVTVITTSPNTWENKDIGLKHTFFILRDCLCDEDPNGYYNEYLNNDLFKHKKVMALLGNKTKPDQSDNQLCGLGFTRNDKITVKINDELYHVDL